jgi:hypothetical protein
MSSTFLRDIEPLLFLPREKNQVKELIRSITREDIQDLAGEFKGASRQVIMEMNNIAASLGNPAILLATLRAQPVAHNLEFQQTIILIKAAEAMYLSEAMGPVDAQYCTTRLIAGYPCRQGMNLMTAFGDSVENSLLHNDSKVDQACVEHFERARKRPLKWSEFLQMSHWLSRVSMKSTLKAVLSHYKELDSLDEIKTLFADCCTHSNLGKRYIEAFRDVIGEEMLVTLCQQQLLNGSSYWSMDAMVKTLGEQSLYTKEFEVALKDEIARPLPTIPSFISLLNANQSDLNPWPKTARLMIDHYTKVFDFKEDRRHHLIDFAASHGLIGKLIEKMIDALRMEFISLDDWNYTEMSAKSHAEILSMGATQSAGNAKRRIRYQHVLQACRKTDLLQMRDLLGNIGIEAFRDVYEASGGAGNKREILKHYPQSKAYILENDLGM